MFLIDSVDRVLAVPSHMLDGKKIDPKQATPKSKSKASKTKKIFVGGVSQDTTTEEVKAYFSQFGKVEEAVMLMDQQTKRHRGFGFVTFENEDVVDSICEIHFHTIKNKKVECKKAQPKEAVQAANSAALLGKRVILNNLGIPTANPMAMPSLIADYSGLTALQPNQSFISLAQAQNQAAAAAALSGYGKIMQVNGHNPHLGGSAGLPFLTNYRYSPYQLPSTLTNTQVAQAQVAAMMAQQQYQTSQSHHDQNIAQQQQQHPLRAPQSIQAVISTSMNLGPNPAMVTMAQAGHLSPSATLSAGGSLMTPSAATKYPSATPGVVNLNPFQV